MSDQPTVKRWDIDTSCECGRYGDDVNKWESPNGEFVLADDYEALEAEYNDYIKTSSAAIAEAVAAERDRCAVLVEGIANQRIRGGELRSDAEHAIIMRCVAAIRAEPTTEGGQE